MKRQITLTPVLTKLFNWINKNTICKWLGHEQKNWWIGKHRPKYCCRCHEYLYKRVRHDETNAEGSTIYDLALSTVPDDIQDKIDKYVDQDEPKLNEKLNEIRKRVPQEVKDRIDKQVEQMENENKIWKSDTGALMSDKDYQQLSDNQKNIMTAVKSGDDNPVAETLPHLEKGDKIKLYGKETTVEGFEVSYNDALNPPQYEIILLTTGRADPFKRSLDVIEVLLKHESTPVIEQKEEHDQEIINMVEWLDKRCAFTDHQKDYVFFGLKDIYKKTLKRQPQSKLLTHQDGWISVKDRLPTIEDGEKVLLYRNVNPDQRLMAISVHYTLMVKYCDQDSFWMPLPKPPQVK